MAKKVTQESFKASIKKKTDEFGKPVGSTDKSAVAKVTQESFKAKIKSKTGGFTVPANTVKTKAPLPKSKSGTVKIVKVTKNHSY